MELQDATNTRQHHSGCFEVYCCKYNYQRNMLIELMTRFPLTFNSTPSVKSWKKELKSEITGWTTLLTDLINSSSRTLNKFFMFWLSICQFQCFGPCTTNRFVCIFGILFGDFAIRWKLTRFLLGLSRAPVGCSRPPEWMVRWALLPSNLIR